MATWSIADPGLPALGLAFDLNEVVRLFAEQWPVGSVRPRLPVTILECQPQSVFYQPATRCVTTYALLIEEVGIGPWSTIGVVEVTPAGLMHRLYLDDPQLPQLACAVAGDAMRERFNTLLEQNGCPTSVEHCVITPIRYKPGSRCTLRYELSTTTGPQAYFGKLLAEDSDRVMAVINTLYQASQMRPEMPRIARPLAYLPELCMGIQSAIDGAELHRCIFDTQVDMAIRQRRMNLAGASLAALHNFTEVDGPRHTLWEDLSNLHVYSPPLAMADSALATRFAKVVDEFATSACDQVEAEVVASHGALRTDQFMIEQERLVLTDLDSFCWANPARDIGNFLAYLRWKAVREPQHRAFIERGEEAFLTGYARARAIPPREWLARYQAASMLKIIGRRFRSLAVSEWPLAARLLDVAVAALR